MVRKISFIIIAIILVIVLAGVFLLGPYLLNVQHYSANPDRGYYADFYLYISPGARKIAESGGSATFLVQPNNSGTNSDDPEVHRKDAWWMGFERHKIADELNVVLLVPAFIRPGEDWHIYTHALDKDVFTTKRKDLFRLDLQLIAMIDEVRSALDNQGIRSNEKFLLQGFSASAMFANRFTILHPDRVLAVAAGSPGGWPIVPIKNYDGSLLPYPAGIGDIENLTGQPFDSTAYVRVPQLIVMGSEDDNDSLDFTDGWDKGDADVVNTHFGNDPKSRWLYAESLYKKMGSSAQFLLVDGIGHDRKKLQQYTTAFFENIVKQMPVN